MSGRQGLRSASSRAAPPQAGQGCVAPPVPEQPRAKSADPKKPSSMGKRAREAMEDDAAQPGQVATLSAEEEQLQDILFGDGAKTTTCVVCCTEGVEWSAGVECPAGHFSCRGCVEKLLEKSLERDPSAVDASEKEQKCYHVKCTATDDDGCGTPFGLKELATVLPAAAFDGLQAKNVELAVHLRMPDAVKEHLEAAAASTGPQTTAQYEVDVRAAFRRPDGTFRDEQGCRVKQCTECGFGPVLKIKCDDMAAHHGDVVRDRRDGSIVYRQDMSCGHCGHLNRSNWATWPDWTGERVLGAVPPVRRTGAVAGPSAPSAPAVGEVAPALWAHIGARARAAMAADLQEVARVRASRPDRERLEAARAREAGDALLSNQRLMPRTAQEAVAGPSAPSAPAVDAAVGRIEAMEEAIRRAHAAGRRDLARRGAERLEAMRAHAAAQAAQAALESPPAREATAREATRVAREQQQRVAREQQQMRQMRTAETRSACAAEDLAREAMTSMESALAPREAPEFPRALVAIRRASGLAREWQHASREAKLPETERMAEAMRTRCEARGRRFRRAQAPPGGQAAVARAAAEVAAAAWARAATAVGAFARHPPYRARLRGALDAIWDAEGAAMEWDESAQRAHMYAYAREAAAMARDAEMMGQRFRDLFRRQEAACAAANDTDDEVGLRNTLQHYAGLWEELVAEMRPQPPPPPVRRSGPANQPPPAIQPPPAPPPPPPLVPGDRVRVRRAIDPPYYGWGGVTHNSVGTLLSTGDPHRVTVDMPGRHNAWLAQLHELELASPRLLEPGDRVRVRHSVRVPRFGWGSVDHDSVGTLLSVTHSRHPQPDRVTATVRFPGYVGTWNAAVEELEYVTSAQAEAAAAPPPPRRPVEDRAHSCGVGDQHQTLVGMGFEGEASLEALVRAARNHSDAERRIAAAVEDLVQRSA